MKKMSLLLVIASVFISCSNEDELAPNEGEKTISGVFNYDILGRQYGWVIPLDGRSVSIPYKYIY